ncbi:Uncharacterised protein [Yersinia nurmii]|uniref:DUF551 domain-containing protein n=1 Tax=Yersinia nurmii TaxID=685706 RepID=A0ABP1YK89_9GAMM|nr:Uncharacterised protein [Yersinia nurmii]
MWNKIEKGAKQPPYCVDVQIYCFTDDAQYVAYRLPDNNFMCDGSDAIITNATHWKHLQARPVN